MRLNRPDVTRPGSFGCTGRHWHVEYIRHIVHHIIRLLTEKISLGSLVIGRLTRDRTNRQNRRRIAQRVRIGERNLYDKGSSVVRPINQRINREIQVRALKISGDANGTACLADPLRRWILGHFVIWLRNVECPAADGVELAQTLQAARIESVSPGIMTEYLQM